MLYHGKDMVFVQTTMGITHLHCKTITLAVICDEQFWEGQEWIWADFWANYSALSLLSKRMPQTIHKGIGVAVSPIKLYLQNMQWPSDHTVTLFYQSSLTSNIDYLNKGLSCPFNSDFLFISIIPACITISPTALILNHLLDLLSCLFLSASSGL